MWWNFSVQKELGRVASDVCKRFKFKAFGD